MNPREKKLLMTLGILAVISIPFLPIWGNGLTSEIGGSAETGENTPGQMDQTIKNLPALNLDQLNAAKEEFSGSRRNLFSFGSTAEAEPQQDQEETEIELETADVNTEEQPAKTATRRLAGYDYLGFHQTDGTRTAVFEWRGRPFLGKEGSIINDTFEIKEIRTKYALIHVIEGDFEQRLKLKAPASEPSGGMK